MIIDQWTGLQPCYAVVAISNSSTASCVSHVVREIMRLMQRLISLKLHDCLLLLKTWNASLCKESTLHHLSHSTISVRLTEGNGVWNEQSHGTLCRRGEEKRCKKSNHHTFKSSCSLQTLTVAIHLYYTCFSITASSSSHTDCLHNVDFIKIDAAFYLSTHMN